jgi:hypothetical protein
MVDLPSFQPVSDLFAKFAKAVEAGLSQEQTLLVQEASGTLADLQYLLQEIIRINSSLIAPAEQHGRDLLDSLRQAGSADPAFDKFLRETPELQPSSISSVHGPGGEDLIPEKDRDAVRELRLKTEQFYQHAHRLTKVIALLPGLEGFEHKPTAIVRNQLIEHPEGKTSKVLFDSFGYGTVTGPVVKAMRVGKEVGPHPDAGLYPNAIGFVEALTRALNEASPK